MKDEAEVERPVHHGAAGTFPAAGSDVRKLKSELLFPTT